jgi:hypothetical protein
VKDERLSYLVRRSSSWQQRVIRHRGKARMSESTVQGCWRQTLDTRHPATSRVAALPGRIRPLRFHARKAWLRSCSIQSESDDLGGPAAARAMSRRHAEAGLFLEQSRRRARSLSASTEISAVVVGCASSTPKYAGFRLNDKVYRSARITASAATLC